MQYERSSEVEKVATSLIKTPAAVRWISAEPLLGPVDLSKEYLTALLGKYPFKHYSGPRTTFAHLLDWVVVGGESGPGARPMHPDWARSLRDQCAAAGVPFFFKQWGEWEPFTLAPPPDTPATKLYWHDWRDGEFSERVGKKEAGRLLDGREWSEYPKAKAVAV